MIKGNPIESSSSSNFDYNIPLFTSERIIYQDTLKSAPVTSQSVLQVSKPKINLDTASIDRQRLDRLFQVAAEREKKLVRPKTTTSTLANTEVKEDTVSFQGSTSRIYSDFIPSFQKSSGYNPGDINDNFLLNISEKTVDIHYKVKDTTKVNTSAVSSVQVPKTEIPTGFEGNLRNYDTHSWYVVVLLLSLSIFAWGKSLYQKYLLQIFNSVYNYQISIQLLRDRNALFRNLSIILQVLFPINVGLLIYFLIEFFQFNHVSPMPLVNIAIYSLSIFLFFRLKTFLYKFLGLVFKVEEDFNEIHHHMNVFNQSLGVILLPFIISMPFLNDSIKNIFLIGLVFVIGVFILLFFFRGFQIVSRKQVPVFFLILYLCAVEILPVVLLVKTSYTII